MSDCLERSIDRGTTAVVTILCLLGWISQPVHAGQQSWGPRIQFSHDYWYFGYMPFEAIVQHSFWIKNVGSDTLRITKVTPECGCTSAPLSKNAVPAGDSAQLKVVFDSKNMIGRMIKGVAIESNDKERPQARVKFLALVNQEHPLVKAKPPVIRFTPSSANKGQLKKTVEIVNNSNSDIDLKVVDCPSSFARVSGTTFKVRSGKAATIEVEQIQIPTNELDVLSSLTVEFTGKEPERLTIPLVFHFRR